MAPGTKTSTPLNHTSIHTTHHHICRRCHILLWGILTALFFVSGSIRAQHGGALSSYSRFGVGLLNDQSQTWNRAMGGVGVALPSSNRLNTMNAASYAHLDSLSFILDAGMSGIFGNMKADGNSKNVNSANFDYIAIGMRLRKGLGIGFGFRPYSTIDYNYSITSPGALRDDITGELVRTTTDYIGAGGLNEVFAGLGWTPFKNFALGANISILWGDLEHYMGQHFTTDGSTNSNFDGFNFYQYASVLTYKLDIGAQYAIRLSPRDWLTIGANVGIGHKFDGEAYLLRFMSTGDTLTVNSEKDAYDLPMTYSAGVSWQHKNRLLVAADAHYQTWGSCRAPMMEITDNTVTYPSTSNLYNNMYTLKAGVEYTPNPLSPKHYYKHMKYRLGISYTSPYMNIPQTYNNRVQMMEGPRELCVSLGLGLPINNRINNRSMVNIGVQWLNRRSATAGFITENYVMLNLGVSFNEMWFMKYKIK